MKRCKKHVAPLYHYEPETQGRRDVTQIEMFDYEEPPVTPVKRRTVPAAKWTDLKASNHKCDDCLKALIEADGHGSLARKANVRRSDTAGSDLLLCYAHAQPYRVEDERLKRIADANA